MLDRALTTQEADMVDLLQEAIARIARGEATAASVVLLTPAGEDFEWFYSAKPERSRLIGASTTALHMLTFEAAADETGG